MLVKVKPFVVLVDADDVLYPCVDLALEIQNKKYGFNPPIQLNEITQWAPTGTRTDCIFECFKDPKFYKKQRPYPGAVDFITGLHKLGAIVCINTAVESCALAIRTQMLLRDFKEITPDKIILSKDKSSVSADVAIDDGPHNILKSNARFPVVWRRPWNASLSGFPSVDNYNAALTLVKEIMQCSVEAEIDATKPIILGLVGSSGSGKTAVARKLVETSNFEQIKTYTTRLPRGTEDGYNFVTPEKFAKLKQKGVFYETTVYSGYEYGSSTEDIEKVIESGKNVVIPVDISGAISLKANFKNVITVFVDRNKREVIKSIIERDCSNEDKINRIVSLDAESKNAEICDIVLNNDADLDEVVEELLNILEL